MRLSTLQERTVASLHAAARRQTQAAVWQHRNAPLLFVIYYQSEVMKLHPAHFTVIAK